MKAAIKDDIRSLSGAERAAVIMLSLGEDHSAKIWSMMDEEEIKEVSQVMSNLGSVSSNVIEKLLVDFVGQMSGTGSLMGSYESTERLLARTAKRDAHEQMAEIFNNFDRQTESRFITALEERSRDSAERIKALMFTFEDLSKLDPGSIQTLLRNVEKDKLGLALKGATDGLRDVFFSNMSERAGKILREDMEAMGPVRLKDVDEAQMRMVNIAKDLANKGEIMIAGGSAEDELVY